MRMFFLFFDYFTKFNGLKKIMTVKELREALFCSVN
jgi:hypothetical protein